MSETTGKVLYNVTQGLNDYQKDLARTNIGAAAASDLSTLAESVAAPATANPVMDGTAAVGVSSKYAREDHVHPTDTSREAVTNKTTVVLGTSDSQYPTDKAVADFVNSSIATNTAHYISDNGEPFTSVANLEAYSGTVTNNDYAFVTGVDSAGNTYYDRYKATVDGSTVTWGLEYRLNNSSFTAAQWSAINSGITAALVSKIHEHSNKSVLDGITETNVSSWNAKKDKQTALEFSGSATKTVKKIAQNSDGVMTVEFEDIDLPQEVPNVNITSTDSSITVTSSIDPDTNTKTFDLSVSDEAEVEYGRFIASDVTATATLIKTRGNLELSDNKIQLKKGTLYHFTVRGSYVATTLSNTLSTLNFIEYSTFNGIHVNVDNSIPDTQFFEFSYDVKTNSDMAYIVSFSSILNAKVSSLEIDVHSVVAGSISGESGISAGKGLYLTSDGKWTTEEPEENFIDITDEWEFDNGFRLQYEGQFPGLGNDMRILYSPVSDTVKFTSSCRINADTPLSINNAGWYVMLRYIGNRFYTTYDAVDPNLAPSIGQSPALGGITLTIGSGSSGTSNNSIVKLAYVGSPNGPITSSGLAIKLAIPDSYSSTYGCILQNLIMKVHKKV